MGNQSIASSFKGILRLSPIMDGKPPYDFLVESYYNDFNYKSSFKYLKDNKILDKKIEALGEDFKVEKLKKYIDDKFKKEGCL